MRIPLHRETDANQKLGLVRLVDIAELLDLTPQHCGQLATRSDFPSPVKTVGKSRWWSRAEVVAWASKRPTVWHERE